MLDFEFWLGGFVFCIDLVLYFSISLFKITLSFWLTAFAFLHSLSITPNTVSTSYVDLAPNRTAPRNTDSALAFLRLNEVSYFLVFSAHAVKSSVSSFGVRSLSFFWLAL